MHEFLKRMAVIIMEFNYPCDTGYFGNVRFDRGLSSVAQMALMLNMELGTLFEIVFIIFRTKLWGNCIYIIYTINIIKLRTVFSPST